MADKTQHPHAEILRAIADGEPIQLWNVYSGEIPEWLDIAPDYYFSYCTKLLADRLRIAPPKVYPVTSYTGGELYELYITPKEGESIQEAFLRIANLILQRYVDEQEAKQ